MRFITLVKVNKSALRQVLAVAIALGLLIVGAARLTAQPPEVKPGTEHEMLKAAEGTWDATVKAMGSESKGSVTFKMALGGLWLLEDFKGDLGGFAFEGHGATSYDPMKKKYVNVWIDSMVTSPMVSEGTYDKSTKTLTMAGDMPTPDGKSMKVTMKTVFNDANTKTFTLTGAGPDGKDMEMVQITYKRRAK
jgi:Protein of unknown function (DUF1579)